MLVVQEIGSGRSSGKRTSVSAVVDPLDRGLQRLRCRFVGGGRWHPAYTRAA